MEELRAAIKQLKQYKSGGPDLTTVEIFKAMSEEPREEVRKLLNQWWNNEQIDPEALRGRVVHIY